MALSHCWGKEKVIETTTSTLEERMDSIQCSELSRTFQDAVTTTRYLCFTIPLFTILRTDKYTIDSWV